MAKKDKDIDVVQPIKPTIKVSISDAQPPAIVSKNTNYTLVALDKDGNEKAGSEFTVISRMFERNYKKLTAKPDGTAEKPIFQVKKNP